MMRAPRKRAIVTVVAAVVMGWMAAGVGALPA